MIPSEKKSRIFRCFVVVLLRMNTFNPSMLTQFFLVFNQMSGITDLNSRLTYYIFTSFEADKLVACYGLISFLHPFFMTKGNLSKMASVCSHLKSLANLMFHSDIEWLRILSRCSSWTLSKKKGFKDNCCDCQGVDYKRT